MALQRCQAIVPLAPYLVDPRDCVSQGRRRQGVAGLAAGAGHLDEPRVLEGGQVLRDRLAGHRQIARELGGRRAAARGEQFDDLAPPLVRERREDRVYARHGADALSAIAVLNSGLVSVTRRSVPSGTGSSSSTTTPPSSQVRARRRSSSTSSTTASRDSPLPQRNAARPPATSSSSASVENHSAS